MFTTRLLPLQDSCASPVTDLVQGSKSFSGSQWFARILTRKAILAENDSIAKAKVGLYNFQAPSQQVTFRGRSEERQGKTQEPEVFSKRTKICRSIDSRWLRVSYSCTTFLGSLQLEYWVLYFLKKSQILLARCCMGHLEWD